MAGLASARNTSELDDRARNLVLPVEANTKIYAGGMVAIDHNGYAVPAQPYGSAPLDVLKVIGVCSGVLNGIPGANAINVAGADTPPNPSNLGAAGAISVVVRRGVFFWDINGSSINFTNIGQLAFAIDDHTVDVASGSAANPVVGRIISVEGGQVAIDHYDKAANAVATGS